MEILNPQISPEHLLSAPLLAREQLGKQLGISLILAPHPDDEALGCSGIIRYLREQETEVYVCFVTNGNASHPHSIKYPPTALAQLREQEALKSCSILNVDPSKTFFLRQPDGRLGDLEIDEKDSLIGHLVRLLKELNVESLFLPWRRDPHPDHIATYNLGKVASEKVSQELQLVEYPIWLWKNSKNEDWPIQGEVEIFRLDITDVMCHKPRAIFAHKSQTSNLITDDSHGFTLTPDLLSPFLTPFEYFFFDVSQKKNPVERTYFENLYSQNIDPWNYQSSDYEKSKYQNIDDQLGKRRFANGLELGCSIGIHTQLLASKCASLLAVDFSDRAIETAKRLNSDLENVRFEVMDLQHDFSVGPFQFISMCEVGYYFNREMLISLFVKIAENLTSKGIFLMVHWTSFVRENPLTGHQVHQIFAEFNDLHNTFRFISKFVHKSYELMLWEKL